MKSWYQSRGILGAIAVVLLALASLFNALANTPSGSPAPGSVAPLPLAPAPLPAEPSAPAPVALAPSAPSGGSGGSGGYDTTSAILAIATGVAGIIAGIGRAKASQRIAPLVSNPAKSDYVSLTDSTNSRSGLSLLALAMLVPLLLPSVGCAQTPAKRWAMANEAFIATQNSLTTAARQGLLTPRDVVDVDAFVQAARRALAAAQTQLPDGGADFATYLSIAEDVLGQVQALYARRLKENVHGPGNVGAADWNHGPGAEPARPRGAVAARQERDHGRATGGTQEPPRDLGPGLGRGSRQGTRLACLRLERLTVFS